jgi:hypothetical protein
VRTGEEESKKERKRKKKTDRQKERQRKTDKTKKERKIQATDLVPNPAKFKYVKSKVR